MEKGWAELGIVIRERRKAEGLTQERLAERADSHWTYISEIENGHRNPSINLLRRLANGLSVSLSELIAEAEGALNSD
ncbi:MAG: helix-turn-helix domain-containing protein [Chloroflexota bacterium]|jgi:transcriptional regulator with XRE-family HTH domain|nr:helix-turn-helix domain-containing protein [Chloroflexota bacterium]